MNRPFGLDEPSVFILHFYKRVSKRSAIDTLRIILALRIHIAMTLLHLLIYCVQKFFQSDSVLSAYQPIYQKKNGRHSGCEFFHLLLFTELTHICIPDQIIVVLYSYTLLCCDEICVFSIFINLVVVMYGDLAIQYSTVLVRIQALKNQDDTSIRILLHSGKIFLLLLQRK